jgi:hypothetical protein
MPVEIIKRIQALRTAEAARRKAAEEAAKTQAELEKQEAARQEREREEKRRAFVAQQTEKILTASGVLEGLQRIDKELLEGNVLKHDINYSLEDGKLSLVWGNGYELLADGTVKGKGDDYDFSLIEVSVDPDKETMSIRGSEIYMFEGDTWKEAKKVEESLALAYVDPRRRVPSRPSYHSERDDGCCCCSGH